MTEPSLEPMSMRADRSAIGLFSVWMEQSRTEEPKRTRCLGGTENENVEPKATPRGTCWSDSTSGAGFGS